MKSNLILLFLCFLSASLLLGQETNKQYLKEIRKHRKHFKKEKKKEANGPLDKKGIKNLAYFPANANFLVEATFTKMEGGTPFEIPTSSGKMKQYVRYGTLDFSLDGKAHSLVVYQSLRLRKIPQYKDYLFLPFTDLTNGETTYGGGRYIDLSIKDLGDNKVSIDFNKCYNPYCAYSDGYNCPIPPEENHLELSISAGEKAFQKEKESH